MKAGAWKLRFISSAVKKPRPVGVVLHSKLQTIFWRCMLQALSEFRWIGLIDLLIVTFVIYRLILLVKGTRAERMLWGLAIIVLVYFISQRMELFTLHWILSNFLSSIVIIVIVVFQRDIRRALVQVGKTSFFSRGESAKEDILPTCTR